MELTLTRCAAQVAASHALLNCLLKEFALPLKMVRYAWPENMEGMVEDLKISTAFDLIPLHIKFSEQIEFFVLVDRTSSLGNHYFQNEVYSRYRGQTWCLLDTNALANRMVNCCASLSGVSNEELLAQIQSSVKLKQDIVNHVKMFEPKPFSNYLASEQNLLFGHPSHPAPKARLWPKDLSHQDFSPEFAVSSQLHLLEVPKSGLWTGKNDLTDEQLLNGFADQTDCQPDQVRISLHPVQASLFLADQRVKKLIQSGVIKDLGLTGFSASPTASLRTMYISEHDFFIKGSLNVRITNCVRKNAWYELQSALFIDGLLNKLTQTNPASTGYLEAVSEPGAISWSPVEANEQDRIWFAEQTGAILRKNFCLSEGHENCFLAGTLFSNNHKLQPNALVFFSQYFSNIDDAVLLNWFDDYQNKLLTPVISLFYNHGIVLEPHLQNTVIVHNDGKIKKLLLRDYEGVKLTHDKGLTWLDDSVHPRVRQSLEYSRENGWNRLSYCLFVNNLSEAILALTSQRPVLAPRMWQQVLTQLNKIKASIEGDTPELDSLIAGGDIQCKTNFKVRLAAQADKQAQYVSLNAPWLEGVA